MENQSQEECNSIPNKIENLSLEDLDHSQIQEKLNDLLHFLETELNLLSKQERYFPDKDQEPVEKFFEISPANTKKKFNQTFFMFEKNFKLEEKKEMFNISKSKKDKNNNNNRCNNSENDSMMQMENPNFFFTSASPKKKEPKNIQLRKQENVNTFTKSNSLSTNSLNKNSKALNQKLLNIEQRLKAYLKESHKFFKTKSIDQFLENSESRKSHNQQGKFISEPDFDKLSNLTQTPNKSFKGPGGDFSNSIGQSSSRCFNNNALNNNQNLLNSSNNNNSNSNIFNNTNNNFNNKQANNNASGFFKMQQQNSNVSSINYSTNYHKAYATTTPFNNSNGTIPSIFKNFFEEKEVKELNKKRHSMAVGQPLHKNTLKNPNFSDCEFKHKYQSNYTANYSNNFSKLNLFLGENQTDSCSGSGNKESRISDFSVDINLNNNLNSDSNEDSLIQGLQEGERSGRTGSFKILKRNSILRERRVSCRTNWDMNSFDVVVEEEKNAFGTNTSEENFEEDQKNCTNA